MTEKEPKHDVSNGIALDCTNPGKGISGDICPTVSAAAIQTAQAGRHLWQTGSPGSLLELLLAETEEKVHLCRELEQTHIELANQPDSMAEADLRLNDRMKAAGKPARQYPERVRHMT